jgi:hypothetical protein
METLGLDRSAMSPAEAYRQIYKLIKNGIKLIVKTPPHTCGRGWVGGVAAV